MASRGNVFDRLGRNRDRPYLSPAAARKSVFDRLRGADPSAAYAALPLPNFCTHTTIQLVFSGDVYTLGMLLTQGGFSGRVLLFGAEEVPRFLVAPAGNRHPAPKAEDVDPEAVTDDEEPPAGRVMQGSAKPALQPVAIAAKALNGIKPAPSQVRIMVSISLEYLRSRIISPTYLLHATIGSSALHP